jgi:catechol 2,3-dioxygenase-like lactoylglutathione lyase family enzyme
MFGRLNHVAIAVPDLNAAIARYRLLGADVSEPQSLPEHGVTVVFIQAENTKIELLYPLGENSPIAAFLERNPGGGTHHLCFEVPDSSKKAFVFWVMAHRRSARMAIPFFSCTRRIWAACSMSLSKFPRHMAETQTP